MIYEKNGLQKLEKLFKELISSISVPVCAKIRILETEEKTLEYAKMLEDVGVSMLVVHGRTKDQIGKTYGIADWNMIALIKKNINIPVISNGGICEYNDIQKCLDATGADGVMVANAILRNPRFFDMKEQFASQFDVSREYLDFAEKYKNTRFYFQNILHLNVFFRDILNELGIKNREKMFSTSDWLSKINDLEKLWNERKIINPNNLTSHINNENENEVNLELQNVNVEEKIEENETKINENIEKENNIEINKNKEIN
eukprot:TRINITY_DN1552_c0_g1_i2.p1 TRINITY_DN1552_c0_g1~~TRINITY_DN1552_c0_g1_i2.p1  ORF type:complete len:259 (+),score=83.08 TRINITY_DN1552_c0_g1_i2:458-1234(+)